MEFSHAIAENSLPQNFQNVITQNCSNCCIIRSSINNICEIDEWVKTFSENTATQWQFRTSKPNKSRKCVCLKTFVCHHSAYHKKSLDEQNRNKRGISKNTACSAQISISVKVTTPNTKRSDCYVKDGLPGLIRIRTSHNHPIESLSALQYLQPLDNVVREKFHEYFEMGMNITAACRYHENKLLLENNSCNTKDDILLDNARVNPTKRTVQHWFNKWRTLKHGSRNGSDSNSQTGCVTIEDVCVTIRELDSKYGSEDNTGIRKFLARLKKIKSHGQYVRFLHSAASNVPLRCSSGASIKVQPTAIQRRKNKLKLSQAITIKRHGKII